jgi:hypothetical protein
VNENVLFAQRQINETIKPEFFFEISARLYDVEYSSTTKASSSVKQGMLQNLCLPPLMDNYWHLWYQPQEGNLG